MLKSTSNMGDFIFKLAAALIIVIILSIAINQLLRQTPIVEVKDCSLTANTVTVNGLTTITFTMVSHDKDNAHEIRVEFSSHPLVTFMLGSQYLPKDNGIWYYTETLNPSASHTQLVNVRASLESGIAKLDYQITINFYRDGTQFYKKDLVLTVQQ